MDWFGTVSKSLVCAASISCSSWLIVAFPKASDCSEMVGSILDIAGRLSSVKSPFSAAVPLSGRTYDVVAWVEAGFCANYLRMSWILQPQLRTVAELNGTRIRP